MDKRTKAESAQMTLTAKQEAFCQAIADGMTQADAYRASYNAEKMKPESVQVKASVLMADGKIALRVAELRGALAKKALWTREKSVAGLVKAFQVAEDAGNAAAMTGSIKELNAMHGFNAPAKVDLMNSDGSMTPKRVEISFVNAASQATE